MSKSDAMRAMREARYARTTTAVPVRRPVTAATGTTDAAGGAKAPAAPRKTAPKKTGARKSGSERAGTQQDQPTDTEPPAGSGTVEPAVGGEKCGHRSMNGRSCTREAGHPEKNHRYS